MKLTPMVTALELDQIQPGLLLWHAYDSVVKADLFSTAISAKKGVFLVDPIQLDKAALAHLLQRGPVTGVIITNGNHFRATGDFLRKFSVPLFGRCESLPIDLAVDFSEVSDAMTICGELEVTAIDGAAGGEIALYHAANGGTLIMGDALINFDPHGFTFLPDKYCQDAGQMRNSLRKLLRFNVERILFAHGLPILSRANERLRQLLQADP